jgi:hypothetical protein
MAGNALERAWPELRIEGGLVDQANRIVEVGYPISLTHQSSDQFPR